MKGTTLFILTAVAAIFFVACGTPPAANNANSNANAAKPTAAAPTADALLTLDKQANEAYIKGDAKFFEGFLSDKFVMYVGGQRIDKAGATKMIGGVKCDVKEGWKLEEPQMAKIDADTYVLSYKGTFDGTCTENGKTDKLPSPVRAATIWVRSGDKWLAAFHGENLIVDPKAPAAPPAKPEAKKEEPKTQTRVTTSDGKPLNEDGKPLNDTKAEGKKEDKEAAAGDANTDALMKVELAAWEAWKAKDAKKLEDLTAKDISFVNIFGTYFATKADTMKDWTEGNKCEIKSVSVTDGVASSLSPTVELLTLKGTADGTCDGQKIGAVISARPFM